MPDIEQVKGKVTIESDTKGAKDAEGALDNFKNALQQVGIVAAGVAIEHLAEQFVSFGKEVFQASLDTASSFEQWKMSFNTMLGSGEKASKLMNEISDFAAKTPFELPQLVEGSKQLIAFGVSADSVVKRLGQLGDIAAGVGTDKLPLLIHAFGQVEAGQQLTGRELNEFVMSGVPLLQALADHYNKLGTASVNAGTTIEKGTKMSASAMTSLQHNIEETQARLKILNSEHVKAGLATDKHNLAIMSANHNLEEYQAKLSGANKVVTSLGTAHKLTTQDIKDMISANEVSAKDVETVLGEMTSKGGRFFDGMNKQSQTFGGIVSNIHDQFSRLSLAIMGFDMDEGSGTFGEIKKGTLFDKIRQGAQFFLNFLNAHQQDIVNFANLLINGFMGAINSVTDAIQKNQKFINDLFNILKIVGGFLMSVFTPIWNDLENLWKRHQKEIQLVAQVLGGVFLVAIVTIIVAIAKLIDTGIRWVDAFFTIASKIKIIMIDMGNVVVGIINDMINYINQLTHIPLVQEAVNIVNAIAGTKINIGTIPTVGKISGGGNVFSNTDISSILGAFTSDQGVKNVKSGVNSGMSIINNNTFNTPYDPTDFAKQLGIQVSMTQG